MPATREERQRGMDRGAKCRRLQGLGTICEPLVGEDGEDVDVLPLLPPDAVVAQRSFEREAGR